MKLRWVEARDVLRKRHCSGNGMQFALRESTLEDARARLTEEIDKCRTMLAEIDAWAREDD